MLSKLVGPSGEVEFDAVINEVTTTDSNVTEHPVEEGADVADHVQIKSETLSLSIVIVGDRASEKLAQLQRFQQERELLTFLGVETAKQVVIENMSRTRTALTGDGFEFSLSLRKIRIARLQEVKLVVPAKSVSKTQTKKTSSKGKQQPKKKKPKQKADTQSRKGRKK